MKNLLRVLVCGLALPVAATFCLPGTVCWAEEAVDQSQAAKAQVTEVEVNANKEQSGQEGSAESGYRNQTVQAGPLGKMPVKDTPYSINVTSGELIENTGAHNMIDALRTNPAVTVWQTQTSYLAAPMITIRGLPIYNQNYARDGLIDYGLEMVPSVENIERIEVLNGLSGFFNGFTSPGGVVNFVSKQPTSTPLAAITVERYGGGQNYVHADLGGPITADRRLTYRINAVAENGDTYLQDQTKRRDLVEANFNYQMSPNTLLKADFYRQNYSQNVVQPTFNLANGVVVPSASAFDATKRYGQPWTFVTNNNTQLGLGIESKLNKILTLRTAYRYINDDRQYRATQAMLLDNVGNYQETYMDFGPQHIDAHSAYALVDAKFDKGSVHHDLTFGYSGSRYLLESNSILFQTLGILNITSPTYYGLPSQSASTDQRSHYSANYDSFLVGDRITFSPTWSALVGMNHAKYRVESEDVVTGVVSGSYTQSKTTPSIALMFKPHPNVSTYVSYVQGLEVGGSAPTGTVNAGQMLAPYADNQWETGVKATLGSTDITAALFRINKINQYTDPGDNVYKQDGRQVHQGLEVTATGKLTDRLTLVSGFTLLHAEITDAADAPTTVGKVPQGMPKRQAKAFLEYAVPGISGLTATAGVNFNGRRPVDAENISFISGVTTYDAG
ncbi:MAG TPA: TonB-dependent receptor, partial [Negativicutes bacterium]